MPFALVVAFFEYAPIDFVVLPLKCVSCVPSIIIYYVVLAFITDRKVGRENLHSGSDV